MVESIRHDKWLKSQDNLKLYSEKFKNFISFDNNKSIEYIEEDITETYHKINQFIDSKLVTMVSRDWLENRNRLNNGYIFKEEKNVQKTNRFIQRKTGGERADSPADSTPDNRANDPNSGDIRYDGPKKRGTYTFRTYSEAKAPTLQKRSEPKESNFSQDKDKIRMKKRGDTSQRAGRVGRPDGVGQEYDTRAGGQGAAAGAGLGNQTYSETIDYSNGNNQSTGKLPGVSPNPLSSDYEQPVKKTFKKFRNIKEFAGFQNDTESGLAGVLGGAGNVEKMDSYKDPLRNIKNDYGLKIKKKKKQEK